MLLLILESEEWKERQRQRDTSVGSLPGIESQTCVCALTGNGTDHISVCGMAPQALGPASQGRWGAFYK